METIFLTTTAAAEATEGGDLFSNIISYAPLLIALVLFYFFLIRPQQKKDKEDQAMRDSLDIGDEIVTAGGIIGRVVSIKDDKLVIETGSDRCKIRVAKWAIAQNLSDAEKKEADKASKKAAKKTE